MNVIKDQEDYVIVQRSMAKLEIILQDLLSMDTPDDENERKRMGLEIRCLRSDIERYEIQLEEYEDKTEMS